MKGTRRRRIRSGESSPSPAVPCVTVTDLSSRRAESTATTSRAAATARGDTPFVRLPCLRSSQLRLALFSLSLSLSRLAFTIHISPRIYTPTPASLVLSVVRARARPAASPHYSRRATPSFRSCASHDAARGEMPCTSLPFMCVSAHVALSCKYVTGARARARLASSSSSPYHSLGCSPLMPLVP